MTTKPFAVLAFTLPLAAVGCMAQTDIDESEVEVAASVAALTTQKWTTVAFEEVDGATIADCRAHLNELEGRGVALVLQWKADFIDDPARWELVRDAASRGIPVWPWLTLPDHLGYFPNSTNYDTWIGSANYLMFLWRSVQGLTPTTVVVDFEMSKDKLLRFDALSKAGNVAGMVSLLQGNVNRSQFSQATTAYRDFVQGAQSLGFKVNMTTLLPLLDDYADGDDSLRQGFNVPIDSATPWNEISFQLHRTIYATSFPVTSYMVYDYARIARQRFSTRAGVGLGLTHAGIAPDAGIVYAGGNDLRLDVEAAVRAGISEDHIGVYSFLGIYRKQPVSQWFQAPRNVAAPRPDLGTGLLHASFQALDVGW